MLTATVNAGISINWKDNDLPLGNGSFITVFAPEFILQLLLDKVVVLTQPVMR